jgi:hypothetical protein
MNLKKIQDIVEYQLAKSEEAKGDDNVLYVKVLEYMMPNLLHMPFGVVMKELKNYSVPSLESVGRARRKLQAEKPWLKPSEEVQKLRADNEQKYLEYARMERR